MFRVMGLLLVGLLLGLSGGRAAGEEKKDPFARWEKAIAGLETRLQDKQPPRDAIFFAGSSSIARWNLAKSFPDLPVVNVGFGGSQIAEVTHFTPRILLPYAPNTIVFYAGDNDIAAGKSPEQVSADFREFVRMVHAKLPKTRILFLSIKPSMSRWKKIERIRRANALIEAESRKDERLRFVEVGQVLLGEDGMPKKELFDKDNLHLSPAGYAAWTRVVLPLLK
jgi:lysophospholipase L1-like esterase